MNQQQVWDRLASQWSRFRKKAPEEVIKFLKNKKGKILDLGCGSGRNLIANPNIQYYGVDFSEEMLKLAEKNAKEKKADAVFFKSDFNKLPFEDNFFDAAIFISTLHCIETAKDRKSALKELYRVMKKNSGALITVWDKNTNNKIKNSKAKEYFVNWQNKGTNCQRYYYFYDKEELKNLLEEVRFKVENISESNEALHSKKNFIFYAKK